jgi:hypothetical protein
MTATPLPRQGKKKPSKSAKTDKAKKAAKAKAKVIALDKPKKADLAERWITVIHPTRMRPEQCKNTVFKWLTSAKNRARLRYIVSVDTTDPMLMGYKAALMSMNEPAVNITVNENNSAIQAINKATQLAVESFDDTDIIVVVSDDFDCPFHWDDALRFHLGDTTDFVAKTDDGLQPWIITLPILDLGYYRRFGYVYNPIYQHMFADTEMTHVADLLDRKITIPIRFPHNHYVTGKNVKDNISVKNDATWMQGEVNYLNRIAENFGLSDPPGELKAGTNHLAWIANKTKQWKA